MPQGKPNSGTHPSGWTIEDRKPNGYYKDKSCIGTLDDGVTPCPRDIMAKGMCSLHYTRMKLTNSLLPLPPKPTPDCSVEGCERKHYGRNYCQLHWGHWYHTGDPLQGTWEQYLEKIRADAVTCDVVCQGVRCDIKIGRGHGDGINHKGSKARGYCSTHDARWRAHGDVRADDPIAIMRSVDEKRPPCLAPDCTEDATGWQGNARYCNPHALRLSKHKRLHTVNNSNIGKTCLVEWCDKVCESGEDKFSKGMCAECAKRLNVTGTTDLSHIMLKRRGIYRTCSVDGCDDNETGETTYCKHHWEKLVYLPNGGRAVSARGTRMYRIRKLNAKSDNHTIAELHQYWRDRGIDPKRCTYCDAWHTKWKKRSGRHDWKSSNGDHVMPLSKGGADTMDNLVPCCISCNASKSNRILHKEWTPPKDRDDWHGWKAA